MNSSRNLIFSLLLVFLMVPHSIHAHDDGYAYPNSGSSSQTGGLTNQVTITTDNNYRYITSNGIPYWHGQFPNQNNPNTVSAQNYKFRVPLNPKLAQKVTELWGGMDFGVGLDGVPFDPGTAELWNNNPNWRYEAMSGKINLGIDQNNAHVQPNGAYHYHALPTELTRNQSSTQHSAIIGYAADGFPMYARYGYAQPNDPDSGIKELTSSYQLRSGTRPNGSPGGTYDGTFTQDYEYVANAGDLDECNGRYGVTPDFPQGTYAYFITMEFPLVPRCFKGTPDQSFVKSGGGPGGQGRQQGRGGPPGMGGGPNMGGSQGGRRPPPPPPRMQ